jgi:apolipoprotein D and lipocalin family protein
MTLYSPYAGLAAALMLMTVSPAQAASARTPRVVPVDASHYRGTWLEIGRRPMWITDGCVAGYTTYRPGARPDQILVEDGCREGSPQGKLKTIRGEGTLVDADTTRAKLRVRYPYLITFHYWVIYRSPDRDWFISTDPHMKDLWIYARSVPGAKKRAEMVRKAKALGYDVRKLEFPAP